MTDHKSPIEQAVDLLFYAPLGLLMNADELMPELAERGRQQVMLARMFGKVAVKQGHAGAEKAFTRLQHLAGNATPLRTASTAPPDGARAADMPATQTSAPVARPQHDDEAAAALAIPDYDSLSASQVVPRLESLSARELDDVRAYEASNRGRKTILNKIDQLQA